MEFRRAIKDVTDIDSKLLRTFWFLCVRPARVFAGESNFTTPLKYFLVIFSISTISNLVLELFTPEEVFNWFIPQRVFLLQQRMPFVGFSMGAAILMSSFLLVLLFLPRKSVLRVALYLGAQVVLFISSGYAIEVAIGARLGRIFSTCLWIILVVWIAFALWSFFRSLHLRYILLRMVAGIIVLATAFIFSVPVADFLEIRLLGFRSFFYVLSKTGIEPRFEKSYDGPDQITDFIHLGDTILAVGREGQAFGFFEIGENAKRAANLSFFPELTHPIGDSIALAVGGDSTGYFVQTNLSNEIFPIVSAADSVSLFDSKLQMISESQGVFWLFGQHESRKAIYPYYGFRRISLEDGKFRMAERFDSVIDRKGHFFYRGAITDSDFLVLDVEANQDDETIKASISKFSASGEHIWQTEVFSKTTRYSPSYSHHLALDHENNFVYSVFSIANDSNRVIRVCKIDSKGGQLLASRFIDPKSDDVSINEIQIAQGDVYLAGELISKFPNHPLKSFRSLGLLLQLHGRDLTEKNRIQYGHEFFHSATSFSDVFVRPQEIVVMMRTDALFLVVPMRTRKMLVFDRDLKM